MHPINALRDSMMIPILTFFHDLTGSYGWAIILLTFTIKLGLMPLTISQFRSMQSMAKLQPKIKELQEKYKDKPEILNQKVLEFYKDNKFNPFGGCLPVLVQMPFLIALYVTLISDEFTKQAAHQSFYFIHDLARLGMNGKDGLYFDNIAMLVAYGLTTYLSQKMVTTNPNDPMQKQMMIMMPIFITITFITLPLPSGIFLYLVVSNLITIGQYMVMGWQGMLPPPPGAAPATGSAGSGNGAQLKPRGDGDAAVDGNGADKGGQDVAPAGDAAVGREKRQAKKSKKKRR